MQEPRATSAGPVNTGLNTAKSLGGDMQSLLCTGPANQASFACRLDREADALLFLGFRQHAERLANQAAELRAGGAA